MPRQRRRKDETFELPLLPRRRGILYPNTTGAILVGRRSTLTAIDDATEGEGMVAVVTQRDPALSEIGPVRHLSRTPPRRTSSGRCACRTARRSSGCRASGGCASSRSAGRRPYYRARVEPVEDPTDTTVAAEALRRAVLALFEKVARLAPSIPDDAYVMAMNIEYAGLAGRLRRVVAEPRRRRGAGPAGHARRARAAGEAEHPPRERARRAGAAGQDPHRACRTSWTSRSASTSCASR